MVPRAEVGGVWRAEESKGAAESPAWGAEVCLVSRVLRLPRFPHRGCSFCVCTRVTVRSPERTHAGAGGERPRNCPLERSLSPYPKAPISFWNVLLEASGWESLEEWLSPTCRVIINVGCFRDLFSEKVS